MQMNRRSFCRFALASGVSSALPAGSILAQALGSSRRIPSSIAAVSLDGADAAIEGSAIKELAETLEGSLLLAGDYGYDGAQDLERDAR